MAKTTILIDVNIGAQVPPTTLWMIWAAPFAFDSGNTVVLPIGAPIKLVNGIGQAQVDPGPWMVTAVGMGFSKTQAWMVPESAVPVQFNALVEITDTDLLGFGPTWAARAELAALEALSSAADAAGSALEAKGYRDQAQAIGDAIPTTTDEIVTDLFEDQSSDFRDAVDAWGNGSYARVIDGVLTGPDGLPISVGGSGTIIYTSGAYPARPGLPAGAVTYIGPVQPTTWLANDSWVDNS
ncbi:hypothetical protein [Agreia sp. COWG]|uniref:hypothetical protein n=1 Tax=Agreia sp. COWG TaxID=2773266 RepID=UPI001925B328|nr:hypothetical protein [Agreia sp. COWG]CAD5999150.1 protein of unknown function [Agreia sp. COWG]